MISSGHKLKPQLADLSWRRSMGLRAWYGASTPLRWLLNRKRAALGQFPITILFYHRVAEIADTPWTCSNRMFARQIAWLKRNVELISLEEAQSRLRSGVNRGPAVSITFDDGYADNCQSALPLLIRERIPCVYFVSWRQVSEGAPFPHDAAWGNRFEINTVDQLREMAAGGIEIGAHTRTHADLGAVEDEETLLDEVVTARDELSAAIGRRVRYFAYPYGQHQNLNFRVFPLAREAGYEAVCSAYGGYNFPGDDPFHLQRVHAEDNLIRVKNWVTVDPRKTAITRYEFETGSQFAPASEGAPQ